MMRICTRLVLAAILGLGVMNCGGGGGEVVTPPPPTPTATIALGASTLSVQAGTSATLAVTLTRGGGFTGDVVLAVTGLPTGVSVAGQTIAAGGATATLTVVASGTAAVGTSSVSVTGTGIGVTIAAQSMTLTITAVPPTATLSLGSAAATVVAGSSTTSTVTLARGGTFTGSVVVAVTGTPAGVTVAGQTIAAGATTATLTIATTTSAAPGVTTLTVTGSGTGVTIPPVTLALTVTAPVVVGSARFLYASNFERNTVDGYRVDTLSGTLTPAAGSPYTMPERGMALALHPSGNFLFAINSSGASGMWVYRIDRTTGALSEVTGSPFAVGTTFPQLLFDPTGTYVVGRAAGSVTWASYRINPATGALTAVSGSASAVTIGGLPAFSPDGRFLFFGGGGFTGLQLEPLAALSGVPLAQAVTQGVVQRGNFLFAVLDDRSLVSIAFNPATGALTRAQTLPPRNPTDAAPRLSFARAGRCLFLTRRSIDAQFNPASAIDGVVIDSTTGAMAYATATPLLARFSQDLVNAFRVASTGEYAHLSIAASFAGGAIPFEIDRSRCIATPTSSGVVSLPLPGYSNPIDLAPGLLVTTFGVTGLTVLRVDPVTRAVTPVPGSPFATSGASVQYIVFR